MRFEGQSPNLSGASFHLGPASFSPGGGRFGGGGAFGFGVSLNFGQNQGPGGSQSFAPQQQFEPQQQQYGAFPDPQNYQSGGPQECEAPQQAGDDSQQAGGASQMQQSPQLMQMQMQMMQMQMQMMQMMMQLMAGQNGGGAGACGGNQGAFSGIPGAYSGSPGGGGGGGGYAGGNNPAGGYASSQPSSSSASSSPTSSTSGTGQVGDIKNQSDFAKAVLEKLGAPVTDANIKSLSTWEKREGGNWNNSAKYNPLNTTQKEQGASNMNKEGVKAYTSWEQGVDATVATLQNGKYSDVVAALKNGNGLSHGHYQGLSTWSGHAYDSI
jgi:hypothetical protein